MCCRVLISCIVSRHLQPEQLHRWDQEGEYTIMYTHSLRKSVFSCLFSIFDRHLPFTSREWGKRGKFAVMWIRIRTSREWGTKRKVCSDVYPDPHGSTGDLLYKNKKIVYSMLWILINLLRIRIQLFFSVRIRIQLFFPVRIRIQLFF